MTRRHAIQAGLILGTFLAALVLPLWGLPFGIDAPAFLVGNPQESAPGYMWILFKPIGLLPPTLALAVLSALSVAGFLVLAEVAEVSPWWAIVSAPAVYTLWLGQMGGIVAFGAALALLVLRDKLPPGWGGIAVLLLLVKPQVGGLLALYMLWVQLRRDRLDLYWSIYAVCAVLMLSAIVYGPWLGPWLDWIMARSGLPSPENLGLGLLALPLLTTIFIQMLPNRRALLLLVVNPLLSPYVQHYDFAVFAVALGGPAVAAGSWAFTALRLLTGTVAWLWWIPFGVFWLFWWREAGRGEGVPSWRFLLAI